MRTTGAGGRRPWFAAVFMVVVLLGVSTWSSRAQAYPWLIRHSYSGCTPCHADPSGGGLLTEYGRGMEDTLLRMHYTAGAGEEEEPGPAAGFAWGQAKLPEQLLVSATYRSLLMNNRVEGASDTRYVQMQSDVRAQVSLGRFRANGSIGYVHEGARLASVTTRDQDNVVSREHWVGVALDEDGAWLLRGGRMNLPFGIRAIEHTLFVRANTRTDIDSAQQHGIALLYGGTAMRGELMAIAGNYQLHPDAYRERGYSGFVEFNVAERAALGASSLLTYAKRDIDLRISNLRSAHGVFARASPWVPLVLLVEADALVQTPPNGTSTVGYASMAQVNFQAVRGLYLMGTGELMDPGGQLSGASWGAWLTADWFFLPHAELRLDAVHRRLAAGASSIAVNTYMAQFHVYL